MDQIGERIAVYLRHKMPQGTDLEVSSVSRIHGGASRETYIAQVRWREGATLCERGMVVRREPEVSLIETKGEIEYRVCEAVSRVGIPVPEALFLEDDPRWLGRPFIVMEEVKNCQVGNVLALEPYGAHGSKLGEQFFRHLGGLAAADADELGLVGVLEAVRSGDVWRREVDQWEKTIDEDALSPVPVVRAGIRWLRRNPPPPAQKISIVHGDYRSGNFLFDAQGDIKALLDWEMAHLGDPLEDLGWAIDPLWANRQPRRCGGMIDREEALRIWEESSGLKIDPAALRWWELFNHVKGCAIWISAAKEFVSGGNIDPNLAFCGLWPIRVQSHLIATKLMSFHEEGCA